MNVLALGFHNDDTVPQLKKLNPDWNIVWIGTEKQRKTYAECKYSYEDLQYGRIEKASYSGAYTEQYPNVFGQFLYYLRMMTRVSGNGWVDWTLPEYINLFNLHYDFFAALFLRHKPDIVLFSNLAHEGFDCVPYLLAKALGIKTLMAIQSPFPNRFFCVTSVEKFGAFDDIPYFEDPSPFKMEKRHFKPHPYLPLRPAYGIDFRTARGLGRLLLDKGPARVVMRFFRLREYRSMMDKYCHLEGLRFDRPFVYFALHMQPELTTTAIGGVYDDQVLAVERLSKLIPSDWIIYVKENPIQTEQYRGTFFFERLARLPNVCLVSQRINTFELIEHSQFVATITGTVGWEAVTGGKNVLVFGHTWYRTLPGVFEFDDQFTIDTIMTYRIDHAEVEKRTGNMLAKMLPGIVDPGYKILWPSFDPESNVRVVAQGLTRYVQFVMT
jgi:hypothetical protein